LAGSAEHPAKRYRAEEQPPEGTEQIIKWRRTIRPGPKGNAWTLDEYTIAEDSQGGVLEMRETWYATTEDRRKTWTCTTAAMQG
jgi:hypothetical protein